MTQGIFALTAEEYHSDTIADQPSLSASIAKLLINASPAHARSQHPRLTPALLREEDEKFDVGTACHALLLEGEAGVHIVYADSWRTQAAKDERDLARSHGRIPLLEKHWLNVEQMAKAVRAQIAAFDCDPPLFADGAAEVTIAWDDAGVQCRARLDWLRTDNAACDDLKTTSRLASPEQFSRTVFSMGYDVQAAFYLRGLRTVTGEDDAAFRFVVAEVASPHCVSVVALAPDALALGEAKVQYAIDLWRGCLERNEWPGYPTRVAYAEMPAYEEMRWLAKEGREAT